MSRRGRRHRGWRETEVSGGNAGVKEREKQCSDEGERKKKGSDVETKQKSASAYVSFIIKELLFLNQT